MQFIADGPDVPEVLLQEHEEGRVVFFCGAGISYKVGLEDFKWLVNKIYHICRTTPTTIEKQAYDNKLYDKTLNILEDRLPGQRLEMRRALAKALRPKSDRTGATETHSALLRLAYTREGALRLVTTNFDRTFQIVARREHHRFDFFSAPMLPIPKNSQWDGLVYLHGLLPSKNADESALNKLVVTSGDFGLAYLTERWAARFVSELFRNYMVCFVGYSINDPVLRYMMDALAADRLRGESTPMAYAMAECTPDSTPDSKKVTTDDWKSKGVIPILYDPNNEHSLLHNTLKVWATDYYNGVRGKERVVVEHAISNPSRSTNQDDFVGRMLWALSDKTGLPAKLFADFNPVPPLTWLETFAENRYCHADLNRFSVPTHSEVDDKLRFSLIRRPAPYNLAPLMSLVSDGVTGSKWDEPMSHLARWLGRHLNDPELIIWLAQNSDRLHDRWVQLIERNLDHFEDLKRADKMTELNEISIHAPNAIPSPLMQTLWRLLLTGRVKSSLRERGVYRWKENFKRYGLTTRLRLELRELLAPKVRLEKSFRLKVDENTQEDTESTRQLVNRELVLASDYVDLFLKELAGDRWREVLPQLLGDFQQLLHDALDLLRELGEADDRKDPSYLDLPSIEPHWQNRDFRDWVTLIKLLRDAWLATRESDPVRATRVAQEWFDLPYPTFKRLALFAATQDNCIAPDIWVKWLVCDDAWWLWSVETQRETMRLLVSQGEMLSPEARFELETTILAGPPLAMCGDDVDPDTWERLVNSSVWLLLAKLAHEETVLSPVARTKLSQIPSGYSGWRTERDDEKNEFPLWISGTGDPGYVATRDIDLAPRKRKELIRWLKQSPQVGRPFYEDTWHETCRTRLFHSLFALRDLAQEGIWPSARWQEALQVWSSEKSLVSRSWRFAGLLVHTMPEDELQKIAHSVAWWLEAVSKSLDSHESILLKLCRRVLGLSYEDDVDTEQPVTRAINHPVGLVTQVLLNLWFKREPNDNETLPKDIESFFTQLCNTKVEQFRHGRVLLASRLIALYRVDRSWTQKHLLPLFDWSANPNEAKAAWEGFLWSPRLYWPLLLAFKAHFLQTVYHYAELGEYKRQFVQFLTFSALDEAEGYTTQEFQNAFKNLPQEGLQEAAQALVWALEGSGEQRENYWKNRVKPFWKKVWPKSRELASNGIAESLACLSIAARGEFPAVLKEVASWLRPLEDPHYVLHRLHESNLCDQFPMDTLKLLDTIIGQQSWVPLELKQCLEKIAQACSNILTEPRYQRLDEYVRMHSN